MPKKKEVEEVNEVEVDESKLDDMSEDELNELDSTDQGTLDKEDSSKDGAQDKTDESAPEGTPDEETKPEAPDGTPEGEVTKESLIQLRKDDPDKFKETLDQLKEDDPELYYDVQSHVRVADTQSKLTKVTQENVDLKKQLAEEKKKRIEAGKPEKPDNYTEEELEDMKVEDPDKYVEVIQKRKEFENQKSEYEEELKTTEKEDQENEVQHIINQRFNTLLDFAGKKLEIDINPDVEFEKQPKEVQEFFSSDEFKKVNDFFVKNPRLYNDDGTLDIEMVFMVDRNLNFDSYALTERKNGRKEVIHDIKSANKGSKFDRIPKSGKEHKIKPLEDLTEEDWDNMSEEELEAIEQEQKNRKE